MRSSAIGCCNSEAPLGDVSEPLLEQLSTISTCTVSSIPGAVRTGQRRVGSNAGCMSHGPRFVEVGYINKRTYRLRQRLF